MNEASLWRLALAQRIASYYRTNPKVRAIAVAGSVAQGYADRCSDIDLLVFWAEPPMVKERRDIIKRAGGRRRTHFPSHAEAGGWSEEFEVGGVTIDVRHMTVETTTRLLADVLERADPSLAKQQYLAALLSALPLSDPAMLTHWQQQVQVYPPELRVAMVRAHLYFRPGWEQEVLAERSDLLALYDSLCAAQKRILIVLMGLNHLYYPGWQWIDRLVDQMQVAPPNLSPRCTQVFAIVGIDPRAAVYQLHDLIEETFRLVETNLDEIDTSQARARFQERRANWEHAPDGLLWEAQRGIPICCEASTDTCPAQVSARWQMRDALLRTQGGCR